ncbi:hypothetical protein ABHF91_15970 [Pseudaeromonas sp. ZJS20]|uniref:hypothetical protein n=1 Tax=Pseudaeromonas aegiceratis TaxID=3153928 RepID=UPI00390C5391
MNKLTLARLQAGLLSFFLTALGLALVAGLVLTDILVLHNDLGERSLTEGAQSAMLGGIVFLFGWCAWHRPAQRGCYLLMAGFFGCLLIRESDAFFDQIHHGFWVIPALLLAAASLLAARAHPGTVLAPLAEVMDSRAWSGLVIGMAIVLVFSRLMGMGVLWHALMGEQFVRGVKNIVEEATESLGYFVVFSSSFGYALVHSRLPQTHASALMSPTPHDTIASRPQQSR